MYIWEGKISDEKEFVLIGKIVVDKYSAIKKEVEKMHSYDCLCIFKIPVDVNGKWLKGEINN